MLRLSPLLPRPGAPLLALPPLRVSPLMSATIPTTSGAERDPLPFPPRGVKRTRRAIERRMAIADRAAMDGDPLAYSRPDPMLSALCAHLDRITA